MVRVSDEDVVVLELARRLRQKSSALYERFLHISARFLVAAEISVPDGPRQRRIIDLTESSLDGAAN
jgi:RNA polymerase-interacting CarD/CdnL/TRCF family regulator